MKRKIRQRKRKPKSLNNLECSVHIIYRENQRNCFKLNEIQKAFGIKEYIYKVAKSARRVSRAHETKKMNDHASIFYFINLSYTFLSLQYYTDFKFCTVVRWMKGFIWPQYYPCITFLLGRARICLHYCNLENFDLFFLNPF
jgi:hypothetical protein